MAVAIWDHEPGAGELLDRRLAAGWQPTPTATVDGAVVLGHAACLARPSGSAASHSSGPCSSTAPARAAQILTR